MKHPFISVPLFGALACAALVLVSPRPAEACGGFFCDNLSFIAIDQTKERILFEVNGDETLTVNVEISYSGSPEAFAWVVPVPASFSGELGVLPPSTLRLLDAATAPRIIPPPQDWDSAPNSGNDDDVAEGEDGVDVVDLPQVGPYQPQLISSEDAEALTAWLNDNGYLITEEMEPFVGNYVSSGMSFLGMKLAPEAKVADIAPISITYPGTEPMIPLVLTAVSAEPEMGVLVFVAGASRYETANYEAMEIDSSMLRADPRTGQTNYYSALSFMADQLDRQAFFTEWADSGSQMRSAVQSSWLGTEDEDDARAYLDELTDTHGYFTRLYTRLTATAIASDPIFSPVANESVSNRHDLSDQPPVSWDDPPISCGDTYCGVGGVCATTDSGIDGCVCGGGYSARAITAPTASSMGPQPTVTCQDQSFDMMVSAVANFTMDPCDDYSCEGGGSCVLVGGFPTCECPVGTAAVAIGGGEIMCSEALETFDPEQVLWPNWPASAFPQGDDDDAAGDDDDDRAINSSCSGCNAGSAGSLQPGALLGLLLLSLVPVLRARGGRPRGR